MLMLCFEAYRMLLREEIFFNVLKYLWTSTSGTGHLCENVDFAVHVMGQLDADADVVVWDIPNLYI